MMSKLKVSFNKLLCPLFFSHRPRRKHIYFTSLLKTLRHFSSTPDKHDKDKILRYWTNPTIPEILSFADRLYEEEQYLEAYELLNKIRHVNEPEVLWRLARLLYSLSLDTIVTADIQWEMIEEARKLLTIAVDIGQRRAKTGQGPTIQGGNSLNVHKWSAIVLDTYYGLLGLDERVKISTKVRDHLVKACELGPRDFAVHHMLGKWHFQMSRLTWIQRAIAKYLIAAEPPRTTYKQAYKYLSKAEDLQPRAFLPNLYLLGKTCLEMGQYFKAKYYLHLATNLPPKDDCGDCCVWMARQLVMKLDRYDLGKNVLYYDPLGFID